MGANRVNCSKLDATGTQIKIIFWQIVNSGPALIVFVVADSDPYLIGENFGFWRQNLWINMWPDVRDSPPLWKTCNFCVLLNRLLNTLCIYSFLEWFHWRFCTKWKVTYCCKLEMPVKRFKMKLPNSLFMLIQVFCFLCHFVFISALITAEPSSLPSSSSYAAFASLFDQSLVSYFCYSCNP